uniref:ATP synthase F0 subunit 8 n=1 Tax=Dotilla wichmanni TaxID=78109 RepID=A0A344GDL0_9EUCA|nr:ATP synthase F0 subunit 8 [Dotilla wichmanni]AXA13780.1 ATP synthase F0 subunit 8 [Dotilla wichmanni]
MPQMAPLYWLYLLFFFLFIFCLFLIMNYFIKPFNYMTSSYSPTPTTFKSWKL